MNRNLKAQYLSLLAAGKLGLSTNVHAEYADGSIATALNMERADTHYVVTCDSNKSCTTEAISGNSDTITPSGFSEQNQHLALTISVKHNSNLPSGEPIDIYLAYSEIVSQSSEWPQAAAGQLLIPSSGLEVISVTRVTPVTEQFFDSPLVNETLSGETARYLPITISVAIPNLDSITGDEIHFQAVSFPAETFDWTNATISPVLTYQIDRTIPNDNPFPGK